MSKYLEVLTPQNSQMIFIDQQPQMAFGVQSIDRQTLKNNVVALAKAAKVFNIPTTITTVETDSFSGNTYPELLAVFPENTILERTSMNSWDDQNVRDALAKNAANGRKKWSFQAFGPRSATPRSHSPACTTPTTKSTWLPTPRAAPPSMRTNTPWTA
jgi:nicotinamidase-related amidase